MIGRPAYPAFTGGEPCLREDPLMFFPVFEVDSQPAQEVCDQGCPTRSACLLWALHHEEFGVWGGTSESDRRRLRRAAGIRCTAPDASPARAAAGRRGGLAARAGVA